MEVVLLERIERLGQMGDVVKVKPGYARNYLLPQKKAMRATKENLVQFESGRQQLEADNLQRRDEAQSVADRLKGLRVVVIRSAGESGQLYGSVNARDMAEVVTEAGFRVTRQQVIAEQPVKALGFHEFCIRLHPEVEVSVTANVARSQEEADTQAKLGRALVGVEEENEVEETEMAPAASDLLEPEAIGAAGAAAEELADKAEDNFAGDTEGIGLESAADEGGKEKSG
ncbi:MAG: 50S ribosomal protein L9 [Alphaproteobacteria bacterium MarineAlpha4_Bin2]|nr:MAG: 50S ribosomal protein L9 [Alphaproteobacteria bacterium MarineAlpha4_Bin2]